jgi:hypothetical protein
MGLTVVEKDDEMISKVFEIDRLNGLVEMEYIFYTRTAQLAMPW